MLHEGGGSGHGDTQDGTGAAALVGDHGIVQTGGDTEGAGDATTSAIICGIARSGKRFRDLDEPELVRLLTDAQLFASESVSRMGTKAARD